MVDATKIAAALDTRFESMDCGELTAREYLKRLLSTLLERGESFSGKRPWGNSGWERELAKPLIMAGALAGEIYDAWPEEFDEAEYALCLKHMVAQL